MKNLRVFFFLVLSYSSLINVRIVISCPLLSSKRDHGFGYFDLAAIILVLYSAYDS